MSRYEFWRHPRRSHLRGRPLTRRSKSSRWRRFGNVGLQDRRAGRVILDALRQRTSGLPLNDGRFPMISGNDDEGERGGAIGSRISDV